MNRRTNIWILRNILKLNAGFTLIELMIGMTLSLLILGGLTELFINTKATYRSQVALSQLQENGRFAVEFLARDLRAADFWGCADLSSAVNHLNPAGTGYQPFNQGIRGTDGAAASALPDNPDSITIASAENSTWTVAQQMTQATANIHLNDGTGLKQGDIVFISDCQGGDIFQVTNSNPEQGKVAVHNTGSATNPGNIQASVPGCPGGNAHCLSQLYGPGAQVYKIRTLIYAIAAGPHGEPELRRSNDALVEGVENLQVLYGEDTGDDNAADRYVSAANVTDWNAVVSARIFLLLRTQEEINDAPIPYNFAGITVTNPGDRRSRRVFTTTVTLRNRTS